MDQARFRLRKGEFEVELSGERAFVEAQLERHLAAWQAMADGAAAEPSHMAVIRVATASNGLGPTEDRVPGSGPGGRASEFPERASSRNGMPGIEDFPRVSPNFRPRVNVSLAEFADMKQAHSPADLFVVAAYYFDKYLQKEAFLLTDLQARLADLPAWECRRAEDVVEEVEARGHVEKLRDGRWAITYKGQNYVREGLAS